MPQPTMDHWQELRIELEREAEAIYACSHEVVVVALDRECDSIMTIFSRAKALKLTYVPEKNAVRCDTEREYSFENITNDTAGLARKLVQQLRRS